MLADLFLPFDLEYLFSSAFVLILVDIITPATAEQWDLSKALALMDELNSRGIIIAVPYKKDLLELDELRQRLKVETQSEGDQSALTAPIHPSNELSNQVQVAEISYSNLGQDLIWSWMANDASELGVLHPSTIQSAIDGLNFDFLSDPTAVEVGCSEWMWGSAVPEDASTPNHNLV